MSTPDEPGYKDTIFVAVDGGKDFASACSACPNPYRPSDRVKWQDAYGWLALGEYAFQCIPDHPVYHKCLLLNNGAELPARLSNVNHKGRSVISEVFVHCGVDGSWRGSAGCITLSPGVFHNFTNLFEDNETGKIILADRGRA